MTDCITTSRSRHVADYLVALTDLLTAIGALHAARDRATAARAALARLEVGDDILPRPAETPRNRERRRQHPVLVELVNPLATAAQEFGELADTNRGE